MNARLILAALILRGVLGAKILALMVIPSRSHHMWNGKYLEALAKRGHQVTYFSVDRFASPPKNISQIVVKGIYELLDSSYDLTELSSLGPYQSDLFLHEWDELESTFIVQSEALKELNRVIRKERFDLVVQDIVGSWFLLGAADVLGRVPVIGVTAFGIPTLALTTLGNPLAYSSKPHFYSKYSNVMSFWQRADNYFLNMWTLMVDWYYMRKQNQFAKEAFGPGIRPLNEILSDMNIILVNSNPATDYPFATVPGLISIGGQHIEPVKPLPQDLKTFLDEAENGVIYFSLGSNIKSSRLKKDKIEILVEAFRQLAPVKVLWKWETDSLPNKPGNVKISKWLPQNDVLAHPNVRLFFTHSGLLSVQESLYHGKPMVGLPFFLDQHVNVDRCVKRGLGEKLDLTSLTVSNLVATLKKVLTNPEFTENARKASAIFRDEIENPLDRAIYWTEYAIRHKGAPHLRDARKDLSWYQNWMLDVLALTVSGALAVLYFAYKAVAAVACKKGNVKEGMKVKKN